MNNNVGQEDEVQSISLPSQLYWRSTLGTPAAWSGSSLRGVYLMDDTNANGSSSLLQNIVIDKRMLRLPTSLRDVTVQNLLSTDDRTPNHRHGPRRKQPTHSSKSNVQLLSYPRIVGSSQSTSSGSSTFFSSNNRASNGIACMDIDNGNDDTITGSPSRYLLVGSSGGDCTIALYDLSYFGSDGYLYQQQQSTSNNTLSQSSTSGGSLASVAHRPIAKSIRHQSSITSTIEEDASAVPSGHKHPLLGCKWYPGDVKQMFVSASISGEILIWDVSNFVPVFATYAHIYTGISRNNNDNDENDGGKTVAPLQCMDLPKSPESCPNGNALLALGLGSSGRGVIQLCDAFRGGSATHELVGHRNGGVNAVLWDPYHPFRLASGGDDCTVRLWDIRKAGSAACLGILNRENEMFSGVGDVSIDDDYSTVIRKKQRASLSTTNNIRTASGIESHGTPVTALAFAPGGDDLVSTGLDGKIHHWDLRPDSCFVSSMDAITSGKNSCDPSVATGGRLYPTSFTDGSSNNNRTASSKRHRYFPHHNKPSLAIIQPGSRCTTTLISTSSSNNGASRGQITGYSLFGKRGKEPGCRDFTLNGHLSDVTCLLPITTTWDNLAVNSRSTNTNHTVSFLTGGLDGMVLSWGSSRRRQYTVSSTDSTHENDISFNNIPYSSPVHHAEQPSEDLDNW